MSSNGSNPNICEKNEYSDSSVFTMFFLIQSHDLLLQKANTNV